MGNKNHVTSKEEDLISEHTQLNNAKIISVDGQQVLRCSVCLDRKDYNRWKGSLQPYQDSSKILMPRSHRFISTTLCGSAGTVEIDYPNFSHLLHTEITNRLHHSNYFSQPELWYLLLALLCAKKQAAQRGEQLGDVRPRNILLNDKGSIKVPSNNSWPNQLNRYQKIIENVGCYLAPEEMKLVENTVQSGNLSESAEIFSIGLTILSAANLRDYEFLYNFQTFKFDYAGFDEGISQLILNNNYSEVLRSTVMNLCSNEEKRRMTLAELWVMLSTHRQAIQGKKNFVIYNAPEKLHEQVQLLRAIFGQKTATYPSNLPDRTSQGLASQRQASVFEKLVPSHLDENTSSAMQIYQ